VNHQGRGDFDAGVRGALGVGAAEDVMQKLDKVARVAVLKRLRRILVFISLSLEQRKTGAALEMVPLSRETVAHNHTLNKTRTSPTTRPPSNPSAYQFAPLYQSDRC
jgi:hypothetical protein